MAAILFLSPPHIEEDHFSSVAQSCLTLCDPWTAACQASLSFTNSWSLFKLMSIESVMSSNHIILCCPLCLLPSVFPSIRTFPSKSVLQCSAFFMVQLSHPYITTGKTITLTKWTFVGKVMSLLFNMLSRFVIAFLPRRNFMAAVTICSDFGVPKNKVSHCFHFPHLFAMK